MISNSNARAGRWGVTTDPGVSQGSVAMSRTGRPSKPPSRRDRISELVMEVKALAVDLHEANLVHARAQMTRTKSLFTKADEVDELWREEREDELAAEAAERDDRHLRAVS